MHKSNGKRLHQKKIVFTILLTCSATIFALDETEATARLNETSCTENGTSSICTGFISKNSKTYPHLIRKRENEKTFKVVTNTSINNIQGALLSIYCKNDHEGRVCIAVGYLGDNKNQAAPLLIQSRDEGINWSQVSISKNIVGILNKINCMKSECVAMGETTINSIPHSIFAKTTDNGKTWIITELDAKSLNMQNYTQMQSNPPPCGGKTVCGSTSSNCVSVMTQGNRGGYYVFYSKDSGTSWHTGSADASADRPYTFVDMKCGADGVNCVAVGSLNGGFHTYGVALRTGNAGITWHVSEYGAGSAPANIGCSWGGTGRLMDVHFTAVSCDSIGLHCTAQATCITDGGSYQDFSLSV